MSKHKRRRERRQKYYQMLAAELAMDKGDKMFINRVISTLNHRGLDYAPDGHPIKSDFWGFVESRRQSDIQTARAGSFLVEKAIGQIQVKPA
ncbi:MAG: hypothetical protein WC299_05595 [Kiritimatiellia bacterium]